MSSKRKSKNGRQLSELAEDADAESEVPTEFAVTGEKRYQWPPPRDPNLRYTGKSRNPVHSILTALPVLMLLAGLYLYFNTEAKQMQGALIESQSVRIDGMFKGLSATSDRHYLWIESDKAARGLRITDDQAQMLESAERGASMLIEAAPRVPNSNTYWVLYLEQSGKVLIDETQAPGPD